MSGTESSTSSSESMQLKLNDMKINTTILQAKFQSFPRKYRNITAVYCKFITTNTLWHSINRHLPPDSFLSGVFGFSGSMTALLSSPASYLNHLSLKVSPNLDFTNGTVYVINLEGYTAHIYTPAVLPVHITSHDAQRRSALCFCTALWKRGGGTKDKEFRLMWENNKKINGSS